MTAQRRRHPSFVQPQNNQRHPLHHDCARFFPITSNARPTSSNNTLKSIAKTVFFGLITTSIAPGNDAPVRTTSLRRRLMRFRSTAPPSCRPTVNPTRAAAAALRPRVSKIKHGHVRRKVASSLLVYPLEIRVLQQPRARGKIIPRFGVSFPPGSTNRRSQLRSSANDGFRRGGEFTRGNPASRRRVCALRATPRQHRGPALGLHASPEPVLF